MTEEKKHLGLVDAEPIIDADRVLEGLARLKKSFANDEDLWQMIYKSVTERLENERKADTVTESGHHNRNI